MDAKKLIKSLKQIGDYEEGKIPLKTTTVDSSQRTIKDKGRIKKKTKKAETKSK